LGGLHPGVHRLRALSELEVGDSGVLVTLDLPPGVQNHLMYMGFVPDAHVRVLHRAPIGDPTVYSVDGIEVALRSETAKSIRVRKVEPPSESVGVVRTTFPDAEVEFVEAGR
jgi:Fe2+ transport system protein FeoA